MTNFRAPSFDAKNGLFIVSAHPSYSIYFANPADGTYGWAGADYGLWGKGVQEAFAAMGAMQFADVDAAALLENDARVADQFDSASRLQDAAK